MKREIKFRGKKVQMRGSMDTSEAGEFVFGSYLWDGYEHFIITDENIEWCVDPETVGQYTGDKNRGYEGDILEWIEPIRGEHGDIEEWEHCRGVVEWDNERSGFIVRCANGNEWLDALMNITVRGNRWDNPDLLEGEKI